MSLIRKFYVYIMASDSNRVLYIGMTNDLHRRVTEHQTHVNKGFTHKYNVTKLIYYEIHYYINDAIAREKQLKKWNRAWKENLIATVNPHWRNQYDDFCFRFPREDNDPFPYH